jgi:hypothetical protein
MDENEDKDGWEAFRARKETPHRLIGAFGFWMQV